MVTRFPHVQSFPFGIPANQSGAVNHHNPHSVIPISMIAPGHQAPPQPPPTMSQAVTVAGLANQMQSQNQMKQMSHPTDYHAAMQHNLAAQGAQQAQMQTNSHSHSYTHNAGMQSSHSQSQSQNQQPKVVPNMNNAMNSMNLTATGSHPPSFRTVPPRKSYSNGNDNYHPAHTQQMGAYAAALSGGSSHHGQNRVMSQPQQEPNKTMQHIAYQPRQTTPTGQAYRPSTSQPNRQPQRPQQPSHTPNQVALFNISQMPYQNAVYQPTGPYLIYRQAYPYYNSAQATPPYVQPRTQTNSIFQPVVDINTNPAMINSAPVVQQSAQISKRERKPLAITHPDTKEIVTIDVRKTTSRASKVTDYEYNEVGGQEVVHQPSMHMVSGAIAPDVHNMLQTADPPVVSAKMDGPDITPIPPSYQKNKIRVESKAIEIKAPPPETPKHTAATVVAETDNKTEQSSHEESKINLVQNTSGQTDLESTISSAGTGSPKSDAHNVESNTSDSGVSLDKVKMSPPPPQPQPVPVIESSLSYDAKSFEPKKQREQRNKEHNNVKMDSPSQQTSEENGNMLAENSSLPPSINETDNSIISTTTTANNDDNTIITSLDSSKLDSNNGNLLVETIEPSFKTNNEATVATITTTTTISAPTQENEVTTEDVINANNTPAKLTAFQTAPGSLNLLQKEVSVASENNTVTAVKPIKSAGSRSLEKLPSATIKYEPGQWSPMNPSGDRKYSITQLMEIGKIEIAKVKPTIDPSLDSILKTSSNKPTQYRNDGHRGFQNAMRLMPNFASGSGGGRGGQMNKVPSQQGRRQDNLGNRSGSRSGDIKKISLSLKGEVKLREVENAWKPKVLLGEDNRPTEEKETEELLRMFRSTLNKLTPDNFTLLVNEIGNAKIDTKDRLQQCMKLVFEKAISEPNYSSVYAQTCKRLEKIDIPTVIGPDGKEPKKVTFRTMLLNQCQSEFEKHRENKSGTTEKLKAIEVEVDEKKRDELKEQFNDDQSKIRRRAVGTVRFIGELYKINMLNDKIMHSCIKLLLFENGDEDSLECLCKLLTTVGKNMEQKDKCLDEYFKRLEQISNKKSENQVSSRIRFAIKDVIDLRKNKWAPRRQETNPKTMNQIQKEKETEERNIELLNFQTPRRDDRRGGSMTGKYGNKKQEGGWMTQSSKSPLDFSKVKTVTTQNDKMVLGPGTLFQQFLNNNRFAGLSDDTSSSSKPEDNYSNNRYDNYNTNNNKGNLHRQGSRENSRHRNDMNGPSRSFQSSIQRQSSSGSNTATAGGTHSQIISRRSQQSEAGPVFSEQDVPKDQEIQKMKALLNTLINEFMANNSIEDFVLDFKQSVTRKYRWVALREMFLLALEKHDPERNVVEKLCYQCLDRQDSTLLTVPEYKLASKQLLGEAVGIEADYPKLFDYIALYLSQGLHAGLITFMDIYNYSSDIIEFDFGGKMLVALFANLLSKYGPARVRELWSKSGLTYAKFLGNNVDEKQVEMFVQTNKLEYIVDSNRVAQVSSKLSGQHEIHSKLKELIASTSKIDHNMVNQWIETHVANVTDKAFIRALTTAAIQYCIKDNKMDESKTEEINALLVKYIDSQEEREIEALYAVQALCNDLSFPQGLLHGICSSLLDTYTISQEAFLSWRDAKQAGPNDQINHGVCMKSLTQLFTEIQEGEDDECEEEV